MSDVLRLGSAEDAADAGAFLTRVTRLDPAALVRLRPAGHGLVELWAWLPLEVLVTRRVGGGLDAADVTVGARDLLARLDQVTPLPPAADARWRGALPGPVGWRRLDAVPAGDLVRVVRAGTETFRLASVGAANPTRVGTALLDHEALVVSDGSESLPVPLRVPQALVRMGFLGAPSGAGAPDVAVSVTRAWARFDATYGSAYRRRGGGLALTPA